MRREHWMILRLVGVVVFGVGIVLGFWPIQVPALNGTANCGSAFKATMYQTDGTGSFIVGECDSARNSRRMWALIVSGVGAVVAFASFYAVAPTGPAPSPVEGEPEDAEPAKLP